MPLFFGLSAEKITMFAVKCLAVGGAFLLGYLFAGGVAALLDRGLFRRRTPPGVKKVAKLLGGLAAAVLAALALFGSGGDGLLGGGAGDGPGKVDGPTGTGTPAAKDDSKTPVRPPDVRPSEGEVRVTVLGGDDVKGSRFYLVDDDATPKTFEELQAAITARAGGEKRPEVAVLFPSRNAVAQDHPAVTRLVRWARERAGLKVTFPAAK